MGMGGGASLGGGTSLGGGFDPSSLKSILIFAALSDPKNVSKYATLLSMITPSAADVKAGEEEEQLETEKSNKIANIDRAMVLLKKIKVGPAVGQWLTLKSRWGLADKDETELYSLIGELGAKKMFEIGGKVLPAQEIQRLKPFVPDVTTANLLNEINLKRLRTETLGLYNKYGSGMPSYSETTGGSYMPSSWQEEEVEQ